MNLLQRIWYRFFVSNSFIKIHYPGVPDNKLPRTFLEIDEMSERQWQAKCKARTQYIAKMRQRQDRL